VTEHAGVRPTLTAPPKVQRGERVAIVSPSWAGPGVFPDVHEIGMKVVRDELGLVPVEYPTTRLVGASPQARAEDLMAAFADPSIRAVLASIGGDDQITVLPFLDDELVKANPKAFIGFSDNTNLLNWLWNLGISSYHGGSTLIHLSRPFGVHEVSITSLRRALFETGTFAIEPLERFTDLNCQWEDPASMLEPMAATPDPGWLWHNATQVVTGPTWGGNLEILHWNLAANRWILPNAAYRGCVLVLETSEEMPPAEEVFRMLRNMGERGLLEQFPALVMGKPKCWRNDRQLTHAERDAFREEQRGAVLEAMATYNPSAMIVFGPDLWHTDPQYVIPFGGSMTVDGPRQRMTADY
jgi:muramoyltetrapeptide carboxypeptidase LdcA involved in peptidoglycan recycling